jgi:hypothetical protein
MADPTADINEIGEKADPSEIPAKALLIEQNALLQAILRELRGEESPIQEPEEQQSEQVVCTVCNTIVEDKEGHGKDCFNWHEDIGQEALQSTYVSKSEWKRNN